MAPTTTNPGWTLDAAPDLQGKVAIVTGATSGIGYETAWGLVRRGATTILAGRNTDKGARAVSSIRQSIPAAKVRFELLDLASLGSTAQFATAVSVAQGGVVDILVNNAGIMAPPTRQLTRDGFEQQIGVNFLAHFALTAWLKDALCAAKGGGRVVNVASLAHRRVSLDLNDFQSENAYVPRVTYGQSKLAMLVFALELHRRAEQNGWNLHSFAAHPGWARTNIINAGMGGGAPGLKTMLIDQVFGMLAQPAKDGALPSLYAATAPEAKDGGYYGPTGWNETRGPVGVARIYPQAVDKEVGRRLWALSEKLTGVTFS